VITKQSAFLPDYGIPNMQCELTSKPLGCQPPRGVYFWLPLLICLVLLFSASGWAGGLPETWNSPRSPEISDRDKEPYVAVAAVTDLSLAPTGETLGLLPLFSAPVDPETPDVELVVLKDRKRFLDPIVRLVALPPAATLPRGGSIPIYLAHKSLLC
jgi:hypothetical protein